MCYAGDMQIPKITILDNAQRDADMVWRFLHHPQSPSFARYITNIHPELGKISDDESAVRHWVAMWHEQHANELHGIKEAQEKILNEKGAPAFALLSNIMDYAWPSDTLYTAFFSLLPFSPFEGNSFFYSVLQDISGKNDPGRSVLSVGIHEISHFIFFVYVRSMTKNTGWSLQQDAVNYLKEALTTVIMNTSEFRKLFGTEPHKGNPELSELYIQDSTTPMTIVPWLERQYAQSRNEQVAFSDWLERMITLFHSAEPSLSTHMSLWRKYGPTIMNDPTLLDQYRVPISLQN